VRVNAQEIRDLLDHMRATIPAGSTTPAGSFRTARPAATHPFSGRETLDKRLS
jgi:hypothetical protein